jgi:hypothetical protein
MMTELKTTDSLLLELQPDSHLQLKLSIMPLFRGSSST